MTTLKTRHGMSSLTESHVTSRDRPRQSHGGPDRESWTSSWWPRRRVIYNCEAAKGPLLTRYYLLEFRGFGLYLHQLHTDDDDRAAHDHPWSFVSFLFHRGYWEYRDAMTPASWRPRFSLLWRPAEWRHRLILEEHPTWTLVLRFRRRRDWGFIVPGKGWQSWESYGKEYCD